MLLSSRTTSEMGAPPLHTLQPETRYFPQWSRTAILTLAGGSEDDILNEVKKSPPESTNGPLIVSGDPVARVAHLEHSVRFLQEQHRSMLSGLHAEIEALRERNRDLQFQLIFNKESSPKLTSPAEDNVESEETRLKQEVARLEREVSSAREETRAAEAKTIQLQALIDAQAEKVRALELKPCSCAAGAASATTSAVAAEEESSRAELRARLAEAERLVRRLRADAERQRREVLAPSSGAVTNLLFDGAAARHAHLQCMKNSLHASLRASGLDSFGYQNNYHFPPVHTPDFWREPLREDFNVGSRGRSTRRPLTLPELSGQQMHRSTIYANKFADQVRPRANGYDKNKKSQSTNGDTTNSKTPEDSTESRLKSMYTTKLSNTREPNKTNSKDTYPELKMVVTKLICQGQVSNGQSSEAGSRPRVRRHHHRKHAPDHT